MSEPTWWQVASPAWLFRVKPAEFEDHGGLCMGVFWLPGVISLVAFHYLFLVNPAQVWLEVGWHPLLALWMCPTVALWAVAIVCDFKFRRQGATWSQVYWFDMAFVNWFGYVTSPVVVVTLPMLAVVCVVSLFQ